LCQVSQVLKGQCCFNFPHYQTNKYERVYLFGHYNPEQESHFVRVYVKDGVAMELTAHHMVMINGGEMIPARSLKAGHILTNVMGDVPKQSEVVRTTVVKEMGVYAPFTQSGLIVVNGHVASTYAHVQGGKSDRLVVGGVETALSFQYLAHLAQAPHRMLCSLNFKACESEQYDEEGLSWYAASQLAALDWLETQEGASKMAIGVGTAVVVLHVLSMMEFLMNHMLMIAVVGFVSWYGMRNTTKPVAVAAAAK